MKSFIFITLFITAKTAGAASYKINCGQFPAPLPGGFCIHTPISNASADVLYHLHGNGGSQQTWQDTFYYPEQIRTEWLQSNSKLPTVVSISFGSTWLLVEKNEKSVSGLFEVFTQKVIPMIEAQMGGLKGRRLLIGESMGGFNSIQLSLKTDIFSKAAILCAPITPVSPFAPMSEIEEYLHTTAVWDYYKKNPKTVLESVDGAIAIVQGFINEPQWTSISPLDLAQTSTTKTQLYVAVGYHDEYAAYEGNVEFVKILQEKNRNIEWRPQWGGHCAIDIPSVSAFLIN